MATTTDGRTDQDAGPEPDQVVMTTDVSARVRRRNWRRAMVPYLFLAPFLLFFVVFLILPLGFAFNISLYVDRLVGGVQFAGLDNYTRALQDPTLREGLLRVAGFFFLQVPVMLVLSTTFALLLDGGTVYLKKVFRLGFFVPYAIPSVIAALMWGYLYGDTFGPLAQAGRALGVDTPNLLSNTLMLPSLANIVTWQWTGYNMLILYAALQAVPADLHGAALVDGATERQFAWHVKLPLIRPAMVLVTVFSIIGSLQLFNEPQIMRTLAPGVIDSGYTPNLYAYNVAFISQEFNYSAAVSFVMGAVVFVLSYGYMLVSTRRERAEGGAG